MAFTIANRRLRASAFDEYNRDGGVTIILRYTLRLLTTQQRDRITKMVVAAELVRQKNYPKYGTEPISIGFWHPLVTYGLVGPLFGLQHHSGA